MRKKDWYRSFGLADDTYIAEAQPDHAAPPRSKKALISLLAACACFALIFCNLWLFMPFRTTPPDVSQYANSEYYGLIQKLNTLTFQPPKYKNNAAKLWSSLKSFSLGFGGTKNMMDPTSPEYDATGNAAEYKDITDNQVAGIIEADRIKRSQTHIFYLDSTEMLRIYSIDKDNSKEVGAYNLLGENDTLLQCEFYLSSDGKTVTLVEQYYTRSSQAPNRYVKLVSLDVSDPANIVEKEKFTITGNYMSSRMVNGTILLFTEFVINKQHLDFDDETTFLPQIDEGNGSHSIRADGIISPEQLNSPRFTVVTKLNEATLDLEGSAAYLSYSDDVYVSENHVFLTHVFAEKTQNEAGVTTRNSMTEISCLSYGGDSFERKGTAVVRGYVKDQWSMDEYEGILRVFTTTNATIISEKRYGNGTVSAEILQTATGQSNASFYAIDLSTFEIVASVIDFAPPREEIQSVRFDKTTAYVCTSIERSDPVFYFDLSDMSHITYKDTGTIEGFSTSLIQLGNGYLLGIGQGAYWRSFKVEVYEETETGVRSVSSYELENTIYSTDYKSYYVDREHQLVGIGIYSNTHSNGGQRYIVLHFDGYELMELLNVELTGSPENMRGVLIDGYMYMFGDRDFAVEKIAD